MYHSDWFVEDQRSDIAVWYNAADVVFRNSIMFSLHVSGKYIWLDQMKIRNMINI